MMMTHTRTMMTILIGLVLACRADAGEPPAWRTDSAWHQGKAESALYEAERVIYGEKRRYETAIYTNAEHVDPATTTKAEDWRAPGMIPVFKHTVSQTIPTENYDYRFLMSGSVRADDLSPYKLTSTSQEDCGTSFREFLIRDGRVEAMQSSYFPGAGHSKAEFRTPESVALHDLLSLTLRDFPFDAETHPTQMLELIPSQYDNRQTKLKPAPARVEYVKRETIDVPYGSVDAHRLRVHHEEDGGATESYYWFAAKPDMRRVLVKYCGPYGMHWQLKRLDWYAYWEQPRPEKSRSTPDDRSPR